MMRESNLVPGLAVIIPCHDSAQTLAVAIESARASGADEVIVVDDGSRDDSAAIALKLGVTLLRQKRLGPANARLSGVLRTTRKFAIFLDADDELVPDGVKQNLEFLTKNKDLIGVVGETLIKKGSKILGKFTFSSGEVTPHQLLERRRPPGPPSCAVWRTEAIWKATKGELPPPRTTHAEDYAFFLAMLAYGRVRFLPTVVNIYLLGEGRSSKNIEKGIKDSESITQYYSESLGIPVKALSPSQRISLGFFRRFFEQGWSSPINKLSFLFLSLIFDPVKYAAWVLKED